MFSKMMLDFHRRLRSCLRTVHTGKHCSNDSIYLRRPILPDYLLDFGHVVLGNVCTKTVHITNIGWFPVSFGIDRASRHQSGFTVELPRVVQLPGAPQHEGVDCIVTFDPRGANLNTGLVEVFVPINVRIVI